MKKGKQCAKRCALSAMIIITLALAPSALSAATACNYYASPTGTGNGLSQSSPFKISNFWPVARPGTTLCLLDGHYTGSSSMITPPQNLRGTSSAPITIKALNDGKVLINGQWGGRPILLYYNEWFIIEGVNACCSSWEVVELATGAHNNIIRRVAAWDAPDNTNTVIFGAHRATHNLFEDVAGWGIGRKIFEFSYGGDFITVRRAWGRWEGSHESGPKLTYSLAYNNYNTICENCLGTWSGERVKETYVLHCPPRSTYSKCGQTFTNYAVDQPLGIFAIDGFTGGDRNARARLLGSIAYVRAGDRFQPGRAVYVTNMDSFEIANTVAYIEPGSYSYKTTFGLYNLSSDLGGPAKNLIATDATGIGGAGAIIHSDWQQTNHAYGSKVSSVPNLFTAPGTGARICYRYKDGTLTSEPLWPWPMNQRIIDATTQSGHTPVDVTATIEAMFGPIPAGCKGTTTSANSTSTASTLPSAPSNLQATP